MAVKRICWVSVAGDGCVRVRRCTSCAMLASSPNTAVSGALPLSSAHDASNAARGVATPDAATRTVLRSQLGAAIDYYITFTGEPSLDGAIRGYRKVTGDAPLYGKWAYGFWQCKEHYKTQDELTAAAATFSDMAAANSRAADRQKRPQSAPQRRRRWF